MGRSKYWPLVSVVIVNWNAREHLRGCLKSIIKSDYSKLEIIIVDNASTDGGIDYISKIFGPDSFRIIRNKKNFGPARAASQGIKKAKGKYISILANDVKVHRACFKEIVKTMESDTKIGVCQAKLLLMDNPKVFDHAGEYLTPFGFLYNRIAGREKDTGQFDQVEEIFSGKGTALTIRAETINKAGSYDEDYFMYLEETDFCWRVWLQGYKVVFVPKAIIYHDTGTATKSLSKRGRRMLVKYYGTRNYITTLIKNLGPLWLVKMLPLHILLWLGIAVFFILKLRVGEAFYILKGIGWNLFNLRKIIRKRKLVQTARGVKDDKIMPIIMKKIGLSYFLRIAKAW